MYKRILTLLASVMLIVCLAITASAAIRGRNIEDLDREINLPLTSFVITGSSAYVPVTSSTTPGLEYDNVLPDIVWADNETTAAVVTFQVPTTYVSDLSFKLLCDQSSAASTTNYVDFDIYINKDGTNTWDSAATNNTPVALDLTAGSSQYVDLTPTAAEISSLAAGDWVTLRLWRDNTTGTGTADLEVYGVSAIYKADQ